MEKKYIEKISQQVYRKFPEMDGKKPKVSKPKAVAKSPIETENFLLVFSEQAKNAAGNTFTKQVRVIAKPDGRIVKISTSK